jgi:Suppressor of fused protein (SUFU)
MGDVMDLGEYKKRYETNNDVGPGWDAIDQELERLYRAQKPVHYASKQHAAVGGAYPLDGVSVYASTSGPIPHLHYVSYGMSKLYYDEEAFGGEFSRWGFEFTFRLEAPANSGEKNSWPVQVMQNLGRYVDTSQKWFEEFHFLGAGGPIRTDRPTSLTAIAFVRDPELGEIETPHGKVLFLQMVGLTTAEFEVELANEGAGIPALLEKLRDGNPLLVTRLDRT